MFGAGFGLVILATLAAWCFSLLFKWIKAPAILGMICGGVVVGSLVVPLFPDAAAPAFGQVASPLRLGVLAVILLRAGLGMSLREVKAAGPLALSLGVLPMLGDAALVTVGGVFFLNLPFASALVLGFLVAAISPAIVIPEMTRVLETAPAGQRKVAGALLAGAPLDNIAALVFLGVAMDLALAGGGSTGQTLLMAPLLAGGGLLAGLGAGLFFLAVAAGVRLKPVVATAVVWLTACGTIALCVTLDLSLVLAVLCLGLTIRHKKPVLAARLTPGLTQMWTVGAVVLFGLIGASLDTASLPTVGLLAVGVILLGQLGRTAVCWGVGKTAGLERKQLLACIAAYMPKATIQAAFASLPLQRGIAHGQTMLSVAVLAVVILAPLGLFAIHRVFPVDPSVKTVA